MRTPVLFLCGVFFLISCRTNTYSQKTYPAGVTTIRAFYAAENKDLTIEVWYPATDTAGMSPHAYLPGFSGKAVENVPPDTSSAPYPLIVFSHGYGGMRDQSVFLTEALASAGYVVAAPDHPDAMALLQSEGLTITEPDLYMQRPKEISFVIDTMSDRTTGDALLKGMVGTRRIGMTGHSLGGYTTLMVSGAQLDVPGLKAACSLTPSVMGCALTDTFDSGVGVIALRDPRVTASVSLAPLSSVFTEEGARRLTIPHMVMGGSNDILTPFASEQKAVFVHLNHPKYLLEISQAGHMTFSDMACRFLSALIDCQNGDRKRRIIVEHEIAFFDYYLKDNPLRESLLQSIETEDYVLTAE